MGETCHDLTSAESIVGSLFLTLIHIYLWLCIDVLHTIKWFSKLVNSWMQKEDWRTIELSSELPEASSHLDSIPLSCLSTIGCVFVIILNSVEYFFIYFPDHFHLSILIPNNESITSRSISHRDSFNLNRCFSAFGFKLFV